MSIEIRAITPDETIAYRRRIREGFGMAETKDDEEWARDFVQPLDRALAAYDGERIVATLRSFANELTLPGGAQVPVGALTSVTSAATHRRRGLLTRMIDRDLRASVERGEVADILIAAEYPIYGRFGYGPAALSTSWELDVRLTQFAEPGVGTVEFVDNETLRKEAPPIFERVRATRPGMIGRRDFVWDLRTDVRRPPEDKEWHGFRVLVRDDDGVAQGWASYKIKDHWDDMVPRSTAQVADLCAATPAAEARLWRYLAELDQIAKVTAEDRPADELLPLLLHNARAARQSYRGDFLWVRPLDVAQLLESRTYDTTGRVVLEVKDAQDIATGRYLLDASPEGATCTRTDEAADVTLSVMALGAASLGETRLAHLHRAGWLDEERPGAVAVADRLLAGAVTPWCNTWF